MFDLAPDLIYVFRKSPLANSMNSVQLRTHFGHNKTKICCLTINYGPCATTQLHCHYWSLLALLSELPFFNHWRVYFKKLFISHAIVFMNKVHAVATLARNKLKSTQKARRQHHPPNSIIKKLPIKPRISSNKRYPKFISVGRQHALLTISEFRNLALHLPKLKRHLCSKALYNKKFTNSFGKQITYLAFLTFLWKLILEFNKGFGLLLSFCFPYYVPHSLF